MMDAQLWLLFDLTLALMLLALGWASLASPDLKRGVVLFIAFGMLLALVWARLRAPDLALAEAIIGAGMTGALLLAALRDLPTGENRAAAGRDWLGWLLGLSALALASVLGWALAQALTTGPAPGQAAAIADAMPRSGVTNPVTGVLLNFRAYDTLLEMAVLLAAVLGILALGRARPAYQRAGPVLTGLLGWLLPLLVVTAGYLLWVGAHAPGGAFQAGALLAAALVLLRMSGRADAGLPGAAARRVLPALGVAAFLIVGLGAMAGGAFLQYPEGGAGALILLIEGAATLSIGATLALAFIGGRLDHPSDQSRPAEESGPC
jgi:multisubunit Na+/H+ antiporter MnhB subunit